MAESGEVGVPQEVPGEGAELLVGIGAREWSSGEEGGGDGCGPEQVTGEHGGAGGWGQWARRLPWGTGI